ncbi:MAG: TRAP transporter substrate-binding protein [Balneolaceae bacterium]
MQVRTFFLFLFTVTSAVIAFYGCTGTPENSTQKTLILAHAMHATHPVTIGMNHMSERLEEISGGNLVVKTYPTGQLGNERALLELVQIGAISMTKISGAVLENIVPPVRVFSLPYLFRDDEHYRNVIEGDIGKALLESGTEYQLKGLAYYDAGWRSFYTKNRPVLTPGDINGMKIRVQPSVMAIDLIRTFGGSATPLAYGELYTAFQGGIVDGAENNPPSFYSSRHYEVTDFYIINEHTAVPDFLVINSSLWDNLSEQEQGWLRQAVDESVAYQHELWVASVEESMQVVADAGVEVIYPDKEPFREMVRPIYDRFQKDFPGLYGDWVEPIRLTE